MKHFAYKVRQQVSYALFAAAGALVLTSTATKADDLDEAIEQMKASAEAPIIDRSIIIKRQPVRGVKLSPDGSMIAYQVLKGRHDEVWLHDVKTSERRKLLTSKEVNRISWSGDGQHLFVRTRQNVNVIKLEEGTLPQIVINLDSEKEEFYYGVDDKLPHAFFVSLKRDADNTYGLYRVFPDGRKEEFFRSEKQVADFLFIPNMGISLIKRNSAGLTSRILKVVDGEEIPFHTCEFRDPCQFISAPDGENAFYIQARLGGDFASLYKWNLDAGTTELVHADPKGTYDIDETILDGRNAEPFLVSYKDSYSTTYGLNDEAQSVVDDLTARIDENFYEIITDHAQRKWMLMGISATHSAPKFYLYDKETKSITRPLKPHLDEIYAEDPRLEDADIGARVAISYKVSDGMTQHGYVTLPRGVDPASVPLVVFPHGGPWARDYGAYKGQAAFLANRGYAVFEPAFRASRGYGYKYLISANRDFGKGRVHQDIMDGMEYVLSRGIGDRNRLAIAGHSFGGFSTVGALAYEPETFKVGFAGAPPVDLVAAVRFLTKRAKSDRELRRLARLEYLSADPDIEGQTEELYAKSPAAHAGKVIKPLYLWAGEKDDRVNILNVRDYALKQQEAGKPISLMVEPRAGHSPRKQLHREAYFYMLEKALHDHVGGRFQQETSVRLQKYLQKALVIDVNNVLSK
ncbi:S9 family peptidase [Kordiimonas laminariae]|uniref:S9 family peptidase n=1 Tax=Kordiimonas laminariae TaxID=2917717 RepID=UPI001FF18526|nr:alpha/beta fold hydrolase [Kordiimonas laminariae]MCK0068943.1 prolyl oligopeptidase family serine peptidase [Kordiimonas laminariae]